MDEIDTVAKAIVQAQANRADLTGAEIAALIRISPAYYSDIRKGNRIPSPEMLGRLAEVLDTPLAPLLWLWLKQHMDGDQTRLLAEWLRAS